MSERDFVRQKNKYLPKVKAWIDENSAGDVIIPLSVSFEDRLTRMTDEEAAEECKTLKVRSMIGKLVVTMRKALRLISFFTTGTDEVRQWSIRVSTKAPQAAGVIHGDFEKTFIQAVITKYDDLKELGSELKVKEAGKLLIKGKEYVMEDGDM